MAGNNDEAPQTQIKRISVLDALKGIAAIQVVITHVGQLISVPEGYIKITNSLTRYEVALFLIISGALLVNQSSQVPAYLGSKKFWLSKIKRIFIPYLICTTMVAIYHKAAWQEFLSWIFLGTAAVPYYFIVVLMQCYLFAFFFPKFFKYKFCMYVGLLVSIASLIVSAIYSIELGAFISGLFVYFCYGGSNAARISAGASLPKNLWAAHFSLLVICLMVFVVLPSEFFNYGYIYAIAIFETLLIILNLPISKTVIKFFGYIGQHSLWIFLIHFAVVKFIFDLFSLQHIDYFSGLLLLAIPMVLLSLIPAIVCSKLYKLLA